MIEIFNGKITISEADKTQSNLLEIVVQFDDKVRLRLKKNEKKKSYAFERVNAPGDGWELPLNAFNHQTQHKENDFLQT